MVGGVSDLVLAGAEEYVAFDGALEASDEVAGRGEECEGDAVVAAQFHHTGTCAHVAEGYDCFEVNGWDAEYFALVERYYHVLTVFGDVCFGCGYEESVEEFSHWSRFLSR